MRTQISGKYSERNPELFEFRGRMIEAGFGVDFPRGEQILSDTGDFIITVAEEASIPFYKAELNFLRKFLT